MKVKYILNFLTVALISIPVFSYSGNIAMEDNTSARFSSRNELLIKYRANAQKAASMRYQKNLGITTIKQFKTIKGSVVKLPGSISVEHALDIFKNDPDVEWAEPNYLRHAYAIPDDAFFNEAWGLNNTGQVVNDTRGTDDADIDAAEAWEIGTGSPSIVIAIIDSGIDYNHPDLRDNIWINEVELNGVEEEDDDNNGYVDDIRGWNFADNNNDPLDSNSHGTHVAGVIGAEGNNATGISGVCWNVKIMPLKFLDAQGVGLVSDEVEAIEYAINNGAHIINASFGDPTYSGLEMDAIGEAQYAGLLFITAAGNEGAHIDRNPVYPAAYTLDNIISVTASNQNDELPLWANYGDVGVDVAAPGENIYSTIPGRTVVWEDDFESVPPDPSDTWTLQADWTRTTSVSYEGDYSLTPGGKDYANDSDNSAVSPSFDFTSRKNIKLSFYLIGESESNDDELFVETNDGNQWSSRPIEIVSDNGSQVFSDGISGSFLNWVYGTVTLDHLEGVDEAYVRFRFVTNGTNNNYDGWYIDNVSITSMDGIYPNPQSQYYGYLDGTSSATPFVSGLAGLIWSRLPSLSAECVKTFIMDGVDPVAAFSSKTLSGGRVNAYNSLYLSLSQGSSCSNDTGGGGATTTVESDSDSGFCFIRTCR
jgi:subtilisin family serine protease